MNYRSSIQTIPQNKTRSQKPWGSPEPGLALLPNPPWLDFLASQYSPISLEQTDRVALLNRTETKFILTTRQVMQVLANIQSAYSILSVYGQRLNHYRTLYFDTHDFYFYRLHVNNRADRYKVRTREYIDSSVSFLEVKHKTRKDRTIKNRLPINPPVSRITAENGNWLNGAIPFDSRRLEPMLWNSFTRITLVNPSSCERVTIDVDLTFSNPTRRIYLDDVAVAEVKRESRRQPSPFLEQMHIQRIHPGGFSKYCIGISLLYDQVKKNALKPTLLRIKKMTEGAIDHE
jgi:hypothetical protein